MSLSGRAASPLLFIGGTVRLIRVGGSGAELVPPCLRNGRATSPFNHENIALRVKMQQHYSTQAMDRVYVTWLVMLRLLFFSRDRET